MDMFAVISRGVAQSGVLAYSRTLSEKKSRRQEDQKAKALEAARQRWIDSLFADSCRTWMGLGEVQKDELTGLAVLLSLAAHVAEAESGNDSLALRIIRGGISTIAQVGQFQGSVLTPENASSLTASARSAMDVIRSAGAGSIARAAVMVHETSQQLEVTHGL